MGLEPGDAEDRLVVSEGGDVEREGFRVVLRCVENGGHVEILGVVGDGSRRDGSSVDDFQLAGKELLDEGDVILLDEVGVDEVRRGARVDHSGDGDLSSVREAEP